MAPVDFLALSAIFLIAHMWWRDTRPIVPKDQEGRKAPPSPSSPRIPPPIHITEIVRETEMLPPPILVMKVEHEVDTPSPLHSPDSKTIVVEHVVKPYWRETGWKANGGRLTGCYRTQSGSFKGYIDGWQSQRPLFYIINPPSALSRHTHSQCFNPRGNGLYWVHFGNPATNVDAGIIEIETVLTEALAGAHRRPR
jgi:hypothetical protein